MAKMAWGLLVLFALYELHYSWFNYRWTNAHIVREVGLIGYVLYDVGTYVAHSFDDIDDVDPEPFNTFLTARRDALALAPTGPPNHKNVVFLQLESIDLSAVDAQHGGEAVMPFTTGLRDRTWWCDNSMDQTGMGRSADAHILVLMGQIPIQNQAIFTRYDLSAARSLPKILNGEGYRTFSLEGYQAEFWRWKVNHQRLGYQESYSMTELDTTEKLGWGVSDRSVVEQAMNKMKDGDKPFFAHIVLLTHHHPFTAVRESLGGSDQGIVNDYLIGARYVDSVIQSLFEGLETRGLLSNTVVAVFSDHDSGVQRELAEHFGHAFNEANVNERIPLFVWVGGDHKQITKPVGLQDLAPTVLQQLGIGIPTSFVGIPLDHETSDVLLQNRTRVRRLDDGVPVVEDLDLDIGTMTRMAIDRPDALVD